LRPVEKDIIDNRNYTTINYNLNGSVKGLKERSKDTEKETISTGLKLGFDQAEIFLAFFNCKEWICRRRDRTSVDPADTSIVKKANAKLLIAGKSLADGTANFKYYFGPNDYKKIGGIAEKFNQNVYLGWPPVILD